MLRSCILPLSLMISAALPATAFAEHVDLPEMSVTGVAGEMIPYPVPQSNVSSPDVGEVFKKLPGANINQNGPLTSIVQYRGMYSDRVNVLIDGVSPATAGPNRMDTPLSYIPSTRLENISIYRGIAPVSSGIETIGGTVKAESKKADFGSSEEAELHGSLDSLYASNGDSRSVGLSTSIANQHHRLQLTGTLDRGNDLEFDGGDILPTEHERDTVGINYGFRQDNTEIELDVNHHDTGDTGTPALPMDIISIRGETAKVAIKQQLNNGGKISVRINYQDTDHTMDNFSLRQAPDDMMMYRVNTADVKAKGIQLGYTQAEWQFGIEADSAEHNSRITNPNSAMFFVNNFNDVERDRLSAFAEWDGSLNSDWDMQSGLRLTRVDSDAGQVNSSMGMLNTLRDSFNNADRSKQDTLADIALNFTRHLTSALDLQLGIARKERAPSYIERYLSAPLQSTSGLADGKTYLGNLDLDPETAYQFELGLDWHQSDFALSPRVFYHHVNDYIQGTAAGTPPAADLQFNNVDAKLYGIDTNWLWALSNQWQLDGTISYVRGKRRDTDDNLYRIAPLTARTQLSYIQSDWRVGVEAVTVAAQNKVSSENGEEKTGGYALFNLSGQYQVNTALTIQAGVNNLLDRKFRDHLGGYNRVSGNDDIAVGERLPGLGRSLYAGLTLNW